MASDGEQQEGMGALARRHRCRFRRAAVVCIVALLLLPSLAARASSDLFHMRQVYFPDLDPFTKWNKVIARTERQRADPRQLCPGDIDRSDCIVARWRAFVATLRPLPISERIARVNDAFNRVPYVPSLVNWRDADHWETPFEFLLYGGQCEDYAIAKLAALSESGMDEHDLRLVVVWDAARRLAHAVAVVYVAGHALVLDNQIKEVMPDTAITRYVPFYAINRLGWWRPVAPGPAATATR